MKCLTAKKRCRFNQFYLCAALLLAALDASSAMAADAPAVLAGQKIRVSVSAGPSGRELVEVRDGDNWVAANDTRGSVTLVRGAGQAEPCRVQTAARTGSGIIAKGTCAGGSFEREIQPGPEPDLIAVTIRFTPNPAIPIAAIEDRISFAPVPRSADTPTEGPLDFVWSQNIKASKDEVAAHWSFKSPAIMFQQGRVFAAIIPRLDLLSADSLKAAPPALDLDVTSGSHAWFSYGVVSSRPLSHSYFQRVFDAPLEAPGGAVEYHYWLAASSQPERLGYRRVARLLWDKFGSPALKQSMDLQRNVKIPDLFLFDDWRHEAWTRYAGEKYFEFDCGGSRCGALSSNRNPYGKWEDAPKEDAWFNSWFQNLRTAYGWYLYGRRTGDGEMMRKAEQILNLALKSPRSSGAFSTIYVHDSRTWLREDGWAGFSEDYHTFCMSWTGYWMLRWAGDLVPSRKGEILAFLRPYADLLLKMQRPSGAIPSWFDDRLQARAEFGDFNAETAGSALFLAEFSEFSSDGRYLAAAVRAQDFVTREVLPRERWYDFETFLSCARKPLDFYDRWTAQYPQNNLSTMQAAQAYLKLYRLTKKPQYLQIGEHVTDYLLLTQQVWNHPLFSPKLLGGTTTQNTDAEWSDARQCYLATLLLDYYQAGGRLDYLERAVAAARSGFAVAPWENWAHNGYPDEHGSLTGFHWGTGSEMASVEMMSGLLGDAYVDAARRQGVGFDACTLENVRVTGNTIAFDLKAAKAGRPSRRIQVRLSGLDPQANYRVVVNGAVAAAASGQSLLSNGVAVDL